MRQLEIPRPAFCHGGLSARRGGPGARGLPQRSSVHLRLHCSAPHPQPFSPAGEKVARRLGWGSLSGCDHGSTRASRVVAFDNFGASICSRFLPGFSRSVSHERSSAVRSHHLPKNLFASTFFALHFLPSRPRIGIPILRLRVKRSTLDFAPNAFR